MVVGIRNRYCTISEYREVLICLLNPELVSLLFIASSLNLTNFYRNFFITSYNELDTYHTFVKKIPVIIRECIYTCQK